MEFIILWIWLSLMIGGLDINNTVKAVVKLTVSAIAAGGAAQITKALVWPFIDMTKFSGVFVQLVAAGFIGVLVYLSFCYFLRSEELTGFLRSLKNRRLLKKVELGDQGEARGI